ncbi:Cupredoxin [Mytilinidion resinicola]|uniref:Cupredoxin n=1 Tax=Mytilinidion resinicola TaxID=574789 RepID=A0A6A6YLS8_9PEZI|nr:Cupredoxin [Mytilinidion resinicola]KAF2808817.1 Cupredoxin [Mytilinidion resinicola]
MHFSTLLTTAVLASTSLAADFAVKVSNKNGDLAFTPNNTKAAQGDTVTFHFYPEAHSVAQGTFAKPCAPKAGGFWSGFVPVASGVSPTTFVVTVNDTKPIWFYCSKASHCQSGMAGAINGPDTGNTTAAYIAASEKASENVSPQNVETGFGGMLTNSSSVSPSASSGSPTQSASGSATGTGAAASTSTGAAPVMELSKGLGLAALLGFLVV